MAACLLTLNFRVSELSHAIFLDLLPPHAIIFVTTMFWQHLSMTTIDIVLAILEGTCVIWLSFIYDAVSCVRH